MLETFPVLYEGQHAKLHVDLSLFSMKLWHTIESIKWVNFQNQNWRCTITQDPKIKRWVVSLDWISSNEIDPHCCATLEL